MTIAKLLILPVLYAVLGILVKILSEEVSTFQQILFRGGLASILATLLVRYGTSIINILPTDWLLVCVRSFLFTILGGVVWIVAMDSAKLGVISFITTLPYEAVWGALLFRERLTRMQFLGFSVGLIGVGFLFELTSNGALTPGWGEVLAVASGVGWGLGVALGKFHSPQLSTRTINALVLWTGVLWSMSLIWILEDARLGPISFPLWGVLLASVLVVSAASLLLNDLARTTSMTTLSVTGMLQPVLTAILGYYCLEESFNAIEALGAVIVLVGIGIFYVPINWISAISKGVPSAIRTGRCGL